MSRWEFSSSNADEPDRPEPTDNARRAGPDKPREPEPGDRHEAYVAARIDSAVKAYYRLRNEIPRPYDPDNPDAPPDTDFFRYADAIPRGMERWTNHEDRWPSSGRAELGEADQPDPQALDPEHHVEATGAIAKVRETEPAVSDATRAVERDNTSGARLVGFEHRLKGDDRLMEKVAKELEAQPNLTPAEVAREIPDAIRYTFCMHSGNYVRGYHEVTAQLAERGYEMYESRNFWGDAEYKGINTRWISQEGVRFEVQVHTPESFHAKEHMTHKAYERLRDPRTGDDERAELKAFQRSVSSRIPLPDGAADIPSYEEGF